MVRVRQLQYLLAFASLTAVALFVSGCRSLESCSVKGKGEKEIKNDYGFDLTAVTKMWVDREVKVTASVGVTASLQVESFKNTMDRMDMVVDGDTLKISEKASTCNSQSHVTVVLTKELQSLEVIGESTVTIDKLNGPLVQTGQSTVTVTDTLSSGPITSSGESRTTVQTLFSESAVTITINSEGKFSVAEGSAPSVTITATRESDLLLGNFTAVSAAIDVSNEATVMGMKLDTLTFTAKSETVIDSTVTSTASGTCSGEGDVTIRGGGDVSGITIGSCKLLTPAKEATSEAVVV